MACTMMQSLQRRSALVQRPAVRAGRRAAFVPARPLRNVRMHSVLPEELRTLEFVPEWPNELFIQSVLERFEPEDEEEEAEGIANVEEARVLYENGWTYLDVRPTLEAEEVGKVKNAVNIPYQNAKYAFDSETRQRVVKKTDNPDFVKMVEKRFPKKDTKLIIACSDGRSYSLKVLEALEDAGYENMVGLRGGYYAWFRTFDNKLNRRRFGEYSEQYGHDGDSCGIHASGAGFARVDAIEHWVPPKF